MSTSEMRGRTGKDVNVRAGRVGWDTGSLESFLETTGGLFSIHTKSLLPRRIQGGKVDVGSRTDNRSKGRVGTRSKERVPGREG